MAYFLNRRCILIKKAVISRTQTQVWHMRKDELYLANCAFFSVYYSIYKIYSPDSYRSSCFLSVFIYYTFI
jgi:hypothetical protein